MIVPLIDVEVLGEIDGQTLGRRRPSIWLEGEVIRVRLLHSHVIEVEVPSRSTWSKKASVQVSHIPCLGPMV